MTDAELLTQFFEADSQDAFRTLVERHEAMVFNTCLRGFEGDTAQAEDAAQAVFILFAQKAATIRSARGIGWWLFRTANFVVANMKREEARRKRREKEAAEMVESTRNGGFEVSWWTGVEARINEAIAGLGRRYQQAVVLHFLEGKTYREVAHELGCSESAVTMRVARAMTKIKARLVKRGVTVSVAALGAYLTGQTAQAATAGFAGSCHAAAMSCLAGSAEAFAVPAGIAQGAMNMMTWLRIRTVSAAAGVAVLLLAGATLATKTGSRPDTGRVVGGEAPAPAGVTGPVYKFDMGETRSDVWPDFTQVTHKSAYDPAQGFGWTEAPRYGHSHETGPYPDKLTCDYVSGGGEGSSYGGKFSFALDLPNGRYGVYVLSGDIGRSYFGGAEYLYGRYEIDGPAKMPHPDIRIAAEGREIVRFVQDVATFLKEEYWKHYREQYDPDVDDWRRYIDSRFKRYMATVQVSDGQLNLDFDGLPVNGLVVYPASDAEGMAGFFETLDAERKRDCLVKPAPRTPKEPATPRDVDRARGYIPFVRHWQHGIGYDDPPKPEELTGEIRVFAAKGEIEAAKFAVYPLQDLGTTRVEVGDFVNVDGGKPLPASMADVRVVQYTPHRQYRTYGVRGFSQIHWDNAPVRKGVNGAYWLTLRIPKDVTIPQGATYGRYKAKVRFLPQRGEPTTLTLKLVVFPFVLEPDEKLWHVMTNAHWGFPGVTFARYAQALMEMGNNLPCVHRSSKAREVDGKVVVDYREWEDEIAMWRGVGFPMSAMMMKGAHSWALRYIPREHFIQRSPHLVIKEFSPEFDRMMQALIGEYVGEFKKRGWPELLWYVSGEAGGEGRLGVETEKRLLQNTQKGGGFSISAMNAMNSVNEATPHCDMPLIGKNILNEESVEIVTGKYGKHLGFYASGRMAHGFYAKATGAKCVMDEGFMAGLYGQPFNGLDGERAGGDWTRLLFAPDGPTPNGYVHETREGADDAAYVAMLQKRIQAARQAGGPAATLAAEAESYLEDVLDNIDLNRPMRHGVSGEAMDRWRLQIAKHIVGLNQALGGR
ncbi:MAG: sigma-70 family RNA polymerase sigma factor [Kiritimatiellae bacterium]|nr:sigma-70 family RNA polymerase sigma factor [Kiritimatiellia bacterium]